MRVTGAPRSRQPWLDDCPNPCQPSGGFKKYIWDLAGVAQWTECRSANQRVASSVPGQGTCLGFRPGPQLWGCERQPTNVSLTHQCCFFPSLSPSFPLSLKINKVKERKGRKKEKRKEKRREKKRKEKKKKINHWLKTINCLEQNQSFLSME